VRILLGEGPQQELTVEADAVRAWDLGGALLCEEKGALTLSARGERIRLGQGKVVDSPVDVSSPSGIRIGGRKVSGRVRVSARQGQLSVVAVVPLEEYVTAVVSREAPPKFHPEALAALAVAVRTYALAAMEKPRESTHDVVAGVEDQVFEGVDDVLDVFRKAADSTRGEALAWHELPARVVYHSTCGGRTENAKDAWGTDVPYLRSVACDDCRNSPAYRWDYRLTRKEGARIALSLGVRPEGDLKFEIAGTSSTGRASRIRISSGGVSRETAAAAFRRSAGYARVKSLKMEIVPVGNGWVFAGHGYGHGVGMCQWGADGMARGGKTYRDILARYYPGTSLSGGIP
jgi:stage II sporulation protein D